MENNTTLDSILGILALAIAVGGILMLLNGVRSMEEK